LLGGLVGARFGLAAPFHFYATGLILASVIAWFVMADTPAPAAGAEPALPQRRSPAEALRAAMPLFGDIRYVVALLATFVGWWTISGPAQVMGALFASRELGFSEAQIGLAVTLLAVGEVLVLLVAGRASDTYGRRAVLVPSLIVSAVATALLGQVGETPILFFPLLMLIGAGIAAGGTAAGGLMADALPREGSGAAVGVNQMAGDLGYLIAPILTLSVAERASFPVAFLVGAIPAAAVTIMAMRLGGRPRSAPEEHPEGPVEPTTAVG
jgi:MFS family permease